MARRGENIYKRRDGRYEGRYVIGRTASGRTRFGYVYARAYAEVRRLLWEKKAEQQKKTGGRAVCRVSLSHWFRHWLENEVLGGVKPSTYQVYRRQIDGHILPALGAYDLAELTPSVVHGFVEQMKASGLADSTVKGVFRLLAAALRFVHEEGQVAQNPCRKIKVMCARSTEQRVLDQQEQKAVLTLAEKQGELPALLGLYTGMRIGEICAFQWTDIDWERRTITVRRTAQRVARMNPGAEEQRSSWSAHPRPRSAGASCPSRRFSWIASRSG